jgi:uncharacterized protein
MDPNVEFTLEVLVMTFMVIGLFGLLVPLIPGLVIIWLSALAYGIAVGFDTIGWVLFALISVLMIAGGIVDNVLIGAKAIQKGASWAALGLGMAAGLLGILLFPPFGGLIGAFIAVFLFEFARHGDWRKALQLTKGMAVGCGWAFFVRFGIGLLMIGAWILWVYVD